jgi:hypothetical protein
MPTLRALTVHDTTIRFTDELWRRVRQTSEREGTSAAQFVRDATVARLAVDEYVRPLQAGLDASLRTFDHRMHQLEQVLRRHGLR